MSDFNKNDIKKTPTVEIKMQRSLVKILTIDNRGNYLYNRWQQFHKIGGDR